MTVMLAEGTEQVMAERRGRKKNRLSYPCEGVCGRMLRPWRRTLAEFPGTAMEYSLNRCAGCWHVRMRELEPDNPQYALSPCTTPGCGNITRPLRESLRSAPGTLTRGKDDGRCSKCTSPAAAQKSVEHTAAGLERFLARMRSDAARLKARSR